MATTQQLTVTASYASGDTQDVTADASYTSSDEDVASVSGSGLVTAVMPGQAEVTVSFSGSSGTCSVTVTDSVDGLSVSPETVNLDPEE